MNLHGIKQKIANSALGRSKILDTNKFLRRAKEILSILFIGQPVVMKTKGLV